jgi:hypothetical protein
MFTSLRLLQHRIRLTHWEVFAALSAIMTLIPGLALIFYPNVYALAKSYNGLAKLFPTPWPLGVFATLAALGVFLLIDRPLGRWCLLCVLLYQTLQFLSSITSVGLSGGTVLYFVFASLTLYAFLKSGGILAPRDI